MSKLDAVLAGTAFLLSLALARTSVAQELPVRVWNVRDGLIQSRVNAIQRDSRGFVWFATWEGVSRFDGRRFVSYGSREGLPNPLAWCIAEGPDQTVWFGTHGGGLARCAPTGVGVLCEPTGPRNPTRRVYQIVFDERGRMWLCTERGVFVSESSRPTQLDFEPLAELGQDATHRALLDADGRLRLVSADELVTCDGRVLVRAPLPAAGLGDVVALARRRAGGAWVAHSRSLFVLEWEANGAAATRREAPLELDANSSLSDVCEDDGGRLWVATSRGLLVIDGATTRRLTSRHGLPDDWIRTLAVESEGGLWIGTHHGGVGFLPDTGVEHFTHRTGLGDGHAVELIEVDAAPRVVATEVAGLFEIAGDAARALPGTDRPPFDRIQANLVRDRDGRWWIGAAEGLFRTIDEALDVTRAQRVGSELGLPDGRCFVFLGERTGTVYASTLEGRVFFKPPGAPRFGPLAGVELGATLRTVAEQGDGATWLGTLEHLWRLRDGRAVKIELAPEFGEQLEPRALLMASDGRLWVGRRFGGVAYTSDPSASMPRFERITARDGLASEAVFALAEDGDGRIYFGTGRGVQRWSRADAKLETLGADDVLLGEWIADLEFDQRGDLWIAHTKGVTRMRPDPPRAWRAPPRARFLRCVVAGAELPLAAEGVCELAPLRVAARDSRLSFEYIAVEPVRGVRFVYETRLEPLEREWSAPTSELSVRFAGLPAGEYLFSVRAIDPGASAPGEAAHATLVVIRPIWARAWFVALAAASVGAAGFAVHSLRLQRRRALERVRTRIASDLHDDLGAGLARIAISSEHARRASEAQARAIAADVAALARSLRESMSDLVWAVDPRLDSLADVAARMRQIAHEAFGENDAQLTFSSSAELDASRLRVSPSEKRNLLLFLKETLTNAVRHAHAKHTSVVLELSKRQLALTVADDGVGFDLNRVARGNGLTNLERRARELGASLTISSAPGRGTKVALALTLRGGRL